MASKEQTGPTSEGSRGHVGQRSFTRVDTRVDTRARASHPQTLIRNWDPTVSDGHKSLQGLWGAPPCGLDHGLPSDSSHPSLSGPRGAGPGAPRSLTELGSRADLTPEAGALGPAASPSCVAGATPCWEPQGGGGDAEVSFCPPLAAGCQRPSVQ